MWKFVLRLATTIGLVAGVPALASAAPGDAPPLGGTGPVTVAPPPGTAPALPPPPATPPLPTPAAPPASLPPKLATIDKPAGGPVDIPFSRLRDIPYYTLNYRLYDDTYEAEGAKARRFAAFRWDNKLYCRYPSGWNGPGAYRLGDRGRVGYGWDGGYPWQGPGTVADHEDAEAYAQARADYAQEFASAGECAPRYRRYAHRYRRIRPAVLRRRD